MTSPDWRGFRRNGASRGFSLLELLVVLAVTLVVAAFAIPTISATLDAFKIRGAMSSSANLAQECRMLAIKRNTTEQMHFGVAANRVALSVTDTPDANAVPKVGDPLLHAQLWVPSEFSTPGLPTGGVTQLTGQIMWGSNLVPQINVDAYFNSRGLPCLPAANGACTPTTGFLYYFRYKGGTRRRWSALSISPAGRIQTWMWNGNAWGN